MIHSQVSSYVEKLIRKLRLTSSCIAHFFAEIFQNIPLVNFLFRYYFLFIDPLDPWKRN